MRAKGTLVVLALATALAVGACGPGVASATVLCQLEEEACSPESTIPASTALNASLKPGTTATIEPLGFKCQGSSLVGKTSSEETEPLTSTVNELTFSECALSETACSLTAVNLPYQASIQYGEAGDGSMTVGSGGGGEPTFKSTCGALKCTYTVQAKLEVNGGEPAELIASKEPLKKVEGGILCPPEPTFSATYVVSAPKPLFVEQKIAVTNTVLCKQAPTESGGTLVCPAGQTYSGKITGNLTPKTELSLKKSPTESIFCANANLGGSFKTDGTASVGGGLMSFELETAGGVCASTFAGKPNVKVEMTNLPYNKAKFVYLQKTAPAGFWVWARNDKLSPELFIEIGGMTKCTYEINSIYNGFYNGVTEESWVLSQPIWQPKPGEPVACPALLTQTASIEIKQSAGGKLFLAEK